MQAVEKATGKTPPELIAPPFPEHLEYVWRWFLSLHNKRGSTGFGPAPIGWTDTQSFFAMRRESPSQFDIELLEALDRIALEDRKKKPDEPKPDTGPKLPTGVKPHLRGKKQKPNPA